MFKEYVYFNHYSHIKTFISSVAYHPSHMHSDVIEIICILEGSAGISDSSLSYRLSEGDVYIFNANDPHCIRSIGGHNIILFLYIDVNHYKALIENLEKMYFICDSYSKKKQLESELEYIKFLMAKILYDYEANKAAEEKIKESTRLLLSFLVENFQFYFYERNESNDLEIKNRKEIKSKQSQLLRIYKIIDYIYDHFREKLLLKDIAKKEYLNEYYLSHFMRKACGLTFQELISLARCEEAEKLLGSTSLSIDAVASEVGFSSRKHLGIQFKKWYKTTPSEYRRNLKKSESSIAKYQPYDEAKARSVIEKYLMQNSRGMHPVFQGTTLKEYIKLLADSWEVYENLKKQASASQTKNISDLFISDSIIPACDYRSFLESYRQYLKKKS